ncbi:MAG: LysM peptidoglycan-binding domain-containing protein [Anaerolineae bacterium]
MDSHGRFPGRGISLPILLAIAILSACGLAGTQPQATPTIVRIPSETHAALATMRAATLWAAGTPEVPPTATSEPIVTPAATVAALPATPVPQVSPMPTATTAAATATAAIEHVVASGETLSAIAFRYGVTVQALAAANGIADPSLIVTGQHLLVPAAATVVPAVPAAVPSPTVSTQNPASGAPGGEIAFQVASGGDIYVVAANGSDLRRVTAGIDPAWSPDGALLAVARWTVLWGLYVVSADGGEERLVLQANLLRGPAWSPDGTRLAFTRQEGGTAADRVCLPGGVRCFDLPAKVESPLGLVNLDGSGREDPLADLRSLTPDWSPAGELLYAGETGLRVTDLRGEPRDLLRDVAAFYPRASPDGSQVALMYRQHDHWEIYIMSADGGGLRVLTASPAFTERPANNVAPEWSPDGKHILFLSDRDGRWRPYLMAADGADQSPFLPEVFDRLDLRYEFAAEHVFSWH